MTRSPTGCASSRTRWAECPARSTASSSCAGSGRSTSGSNATIVARWLAGRDDVALVRYPGLADGPHAHPQAALAARQMRAGGGMVSFVPRPGGAHGRTAEERAVAICESTRLFTLAESLGGVESLIEMPAVMTHLAVAHSPLEVEPALVRLSVGIEAADDLVADLAQALDSVV
jgi:cystathionine gamma-synthase